jgi:RNA polymerase sigma factor (sigma-70 family)
MVKKPEADCADTDGHRSGTVRSTPDVRAWFAREVLPLEAMLMKFLRYNWRNAGEIEDILQDIYVRVFEAAHKEIPDQPKAFVFTAARNLLINRYRQLQVVPIEAVCDFEVLGVAIDEPTPDRSIIARDELRKLQHALDRLPPRVREAVILKRIEGLSRREIAARMEIGEGTVKEYLADAMNMLSDMFYRDQAEPERRG